MENLVSTTASPNSKILTITPPVSDLPCSDFFQNVTTTATRKLICHSTSHRPLRLVWPSSSRCYASPSLAELSLSEHGHCLGCP